MIPIFSKIFEKIIYERLYSFFTANSVIYDKQFGFRKHHSTSHAVNYSVNKIMTEIEAKRHVIGIFVDLSKAFDTIDHKKLLIKLEHYGIRGVCHTLLSNYLLNRTQYTNFQNSSSDACVVEFGVPQGSVLGPLLFLIYINDLISSSALGHFVLFADDTNIFVSGESKNDAYNNANKVMDDISKYMYTNQLHINMDKSVYMYFRPSLSYSERLTCARTQEYGSEPVIKIGNTKLKKVDKVKFLGVIIDENLSWEPHIEHLTAKLNSSIVMIKRIIKFVPKSEYMKLYDALFKSHLAYCISSWGSIPKFKLDCIFRIQKRCIRLLFGLEFSYDHAGYYETCARVRSYENQMSKKNYSLEHTKPLFNKHKILTLSNLSVYHTFLELFKILKYRTPISIYEFYTLSEQETNFRLLLPIVDLEKSKNNFVFNSCVIWNRLVENILERSLPNEKGIVVQGSGKNSDFCASMPFIKNKLKSELLNLQGLGNNTDWIPDNFLQ